MVDHGFRQLILSAKQAKDVEQKFVVYKKAIDARHKSVKVLLTLPLDTKGDFIPKNHQPLYPSFTFINTKKITDPHTVHIVGMGPTGLFTALTLLQYGIRPILFERGKNVSERKKDIALLNRNIRLNAESNYCFGEGGAGTFSDGKLYTRSNKRGSIENVLRLFHHFGASDNILYESHPHIGSDKLPGIISNIRQCILENGGVIHYNAKIENFTSLINDRHCPLVIATGQSARDVIHEMQIEGFEIRAKGFAVGFRVEHPQKLIDDIMWHQQPELISDLGHATYQLAANINGRGAYSFCMCPGGMIVPATHKLGYMVVNGMSNSRRNSPFANAGLVVEVRPSDIINSDAVPLDLITFQERLEQTAFHLAREASGMGVQAPAQRLTDFVHNIPSSSLPATSYLPGVVSVPLHEVFPSFISDTIRLACLRFDKKFRGWLCSDAILVGVESRTSSAVVISRDDNHFYSTRFSNVYPCGEGAGYAGGITSCAIDGVNVANAIIKNQGW